jgi:pyridoxine 5-phosphate synthase
LANAWWAGDQALVQAELARLQAGILLGRSLGLRTHAGHGLALSSDLPAERDRHETSSAFIVAALPDVAELHIGHALIGRALFVGLRQAIADFKAESIRARVPATA